ncbi:GNAT family N-acetyltransferase [Hoeflea ulvae]|uniref:L-ornithine N(alpha)-acyltransferase n=1 Tax=Hoeflea ulvae TaxID=2983764 RepID=A0ABT3YBD3_9HYPH|nr:GNAT family N-acetyltransferase [Hoeflea ulvae]MCY0093191.1 GNAT family N-acetyltransferase [Hoeflea ulvae]
MTRPFLAPIAKFQPEDRILGRIGSLEVRLAATHSEIEAAQALRYRVFVEEMGAQLPADAMLQKRDFDRVDRYCDHLLVLDTALTGSTEDQIVGTYRLLRQEVAARHDGFYSQNEFDVMDLVGRSPDKRFLELGRSCVLSTYRIRRTLEALWQGTWAYALGHGIDVMFGCASFPGARPYAHALALSFLNQTAAANDEWNVRAIAGRGLSMDMMPAEAINPRAAIAAMPPLVKGYLRVGAVVSREAVVDTAFRTTDVLVMLPVKQINGRYLNHYGADASRFAA